MVSVLLVQVAPTVHKEGPTDDEVALSDNGPGGDYRANGILPAEDGLASVEYASSSLALVYLTTMTNDPEFVTEVIQFVRGCRGRGHSLSQVLRQVEDEYAILFLNEKELTRFVTNHYNDYEKLYKDHPDHPQI